MERKVAKLGNSINQLVMFLLDALALYFPERGRPERRLQRKFDVALGNPPSVAETLIGILANPCQSSSPREGQGPIQSLAVVALQDYDATIWSHIAGLP